MQKVDGWVTK